MKKAKKIAIIVAVSMIVVGVITTVGSLAFVQFDATKLNTMEWETKTYSVEESFTNISIQGNDAAVFLVPATDGNCKVVCTENEVIYDKIEVVNNTLTIERVDESEWYHNIGVYFGEIEVTVYLPEKEYEALFIDNSSGRIDVPGDFTFAEAEVLNSSGRINFMADVDGALKVENTSGGVHLEDVECANLTGSNSSGKISCTNVIVSGAMNLENSSGGIALEACDAANLKLESTSGSIKGSLLTEKIFQADATSGSVDVPKTTSGGVCEVTTTSGSIKMSIVE